MTDNIYTFHKTVQGYRHIQEEIACQDCSISANSSDKGYQIIALGDGHGDPACHRSDKGSAFVVEITKECLENFASAVLSENMDFSYPRQQSECVKQLTDTIISKWREAVRDDLEKYEINDEDLKEAGSYKVRYQKKEGLEHLYGTTLIAALRVDKYLLLIQQGDGRCDVFYGDGSIEQPIPWDERCEGPITTSMCDEDAPNRIRTKVIDLEQKNVVACYIGSDGVEDSYYNNEKTQQGTHRFYMDLTCKLYEYGVQQFDNYLNDMLPEFSKAGSTDDVSVAGIINLEMISDLVKDYKNRIEKYDYVADLRKKLELAEAKIISMTRKHSILYDQIGDIKAELDKEKRGLQPYENKLQQLKFEREPILQEVNKIKEKREPDKQELRVTSERFGTNPDCYKTYRLHMDKLSQYDEQIKNAEDKWNIYVDKVQDIEKRLTEAQSAYDEYDMKYKYIKKEKQRIENKIADLKEWTQELV